MLGKYYDGDFGISKKKIYDLIKNDFPNFKVISSELRFRRLNTWYHMLRNHKGDERNIFNYCPPGPVNFRNILTLAKLISKDILICPNYIPFEN